MIKLTQETEDVVAVIAKALPLLNCEHRANRPNPRVKGERIVGFVIGENDIGLGLSEPLFALDALVKLAKLSQSLSDRIDVLESENDRLESALRIELWNERMLRGGKQDKVIAQINKEIASIKATGRPRASLRTTHREVNDATNLD